MPDYIKAYELQQRNGLTRQQILELAQTGPVVVRNGIYGSYNTIGTADDSEYFEYGFQFLKKVVVSNWSNLPPRFEYESNEDWNKRIYDIFPDVLNGKIAYELLGENCPEEIQNNLNKDYPMRRIVSMMANNRMINLFDIPEPWRVNRKTIWAYLSNQPSIAVDLYFVKIFKEDLFFDEDNLPNSKAIMNSRPIIQDKVNADETVSQVLTDKKQITPLIENKLRINLGLTGPERRYLVALVERLKGATFESCYGIANPDTQMRDQRNLNKQGREYCEKAHKVAQIKMGVNFDFNIIVGKS